MQIIRTIGWVLLTAIVVVFLAMNWQNKVAVNLWPIDGDKYIHFEWPAGVVALVFFGLGMAPVWLYLRAVRWRLGRRIANLENSLRATSLPSINARADDAVSTGGASIETSLPTSSPET